MATTDLHVQNLWQPLVKEMAKLRGYRVPFVASGEYLTRLLTDALTGDIDAYRDLRVASIHHHQYRQICDAIKEKYGYED